MRWAPFLLEKLDAPQEMRRPPGMIRRAIFMHLRRFFMTAFAPAFLALSGCAATPNDSSNDSGDTPQAGSAGSGAGGTPVVNGPHAGASGLSSGGAATGGLGNAGSTGTGGANTGGSSGATSGGSGGGTAGGPPSTFAEDEGADCPAATLPEAASLPAVAKLPDPFKKLDGTRLTSKAEWRCHRHDTKQQAEKYVYGAKPAKPEMVTGTVSDTSITVNVTHQGKSTDFTVSVSLPSTGAKPYPAIIGLKSGFFAYPLDENLVKGEGVALINYDPYEIGAETGASRNNKQGAFYDIYGSNSPTGLLVAWSWGVSRIIDVIEQSGGNIIKADALGISGCSRFGKGAFTIGAFDQRIALTLPIESGSGGVPIWRGIQAEGAQTPSSAYGETYWLGDAFSAFTGKVTSLPVDTHQVVGMIAPRGLFIMDNPHIVNLGPKSAHVAALGGAEIYKALGAGGNISYVSAVADGGHCGFRPEWAEPLKKAIGAHLKKAGGATSTISAAAKATGNLSEWREWDTPTLD
jgi:hypothetical protein